MPSNVITLPALQPGLVVDGYRLLTVLGAGGMGVVYQAQQSSLNRLVCLKFLDPRRTADREFIKRFEKEGRALATLNHPNIITIHDIAQWQGHFYIVMEFVDGMSLHQLISDDLLNPRRYPEIIRCVGSAIHYTHARSILHRDIKPGNILIGKNGVVKVSDFGIAMMVGFTNGVSGTGVIGTENYRAPEILSGRRYDHRADIFSLGVTFYRMMTGEPPDGVRGVSSLNPAIPRAVDAVIQSALAADPARRPATVEDFCLSLLQAIMSSTDRPRSLADSHYSLPPESRGSSHDVIKPGRPLPQTPQISPPLPGNPTGPVVKNPPLDLVHESATQLTDPSVQGSAPGSPGAPMPAAIGSRASTRIALPSPPSRRSVAFLLITTGCLLALATVWFAVTSHRAAEAPRSATQITPTVSINAPTAPPAAPKTATPSPRSEVERLPSAWVYASQLEIPSNPYCFIATVPGRDAIVVSTVNNGSLDADDSKAAIFLISNPRSSNPIITLLLEINAPPQHGFSGIVVTPDGKAAFASIDMGDPLTSSIRKITLTGSPVTTFGSGGEVVPGRRCLGLAYAADSLLVLFAWGEVAMIDPQTGTLGTARAKLGNHVLRDLAFDPIDQQLWAYGHSKLVRLPTGGGPAFLTGQPEVIALPGESPPRAAEGVGLDPATGTILFSPHGSRLVVARAINGQERTSQLDFDAVSVHLSDVAVSSDARWLYMTDIARGSIHVLRRAR